MSVSSGFIHRELSEPWPKLMPFLLLSARLRGAADGHADLSYVYEATEKSHQHSPINCICDQSTGAGAPVTSERIVREIATRSPIAVVRTPQFLREGAAIPRFQASRSYCG